MKITIELDSTTEADNPVLRVLFPSSFVPGEDPTTPTPEPVKATRTRTPKPVEPAPAPTPEPTPEPEEEPEDDGADLLAPEPEGATMKDAVALATKLVNGGKSADVKAALTTLGAKRVSELAGAKIAAFVEALS